MYFDSPVYILGVPSYSLLVYFNSLVWNRLSCNHDVDIRTYKIKDVSEFRKTTLFKVFVESVIDGATEVAENKVKAKKEARIGDRCRAVKVLSSI